MVKEKRLLTSESVTEGHPDKICDQISDAILDAVMEQDPNARVAIETSVKTGLVWVFGELTTTAYIDVQTIVRNKIREIGYTRGKFGFDADNVGIIVTIEEQSPDIAQGVDSAEDKSEELGAGDQGIMFGGAVNETEELMPLPISLSHKLSFELSRLRKSGELSYLRPDGKTQVTVEYDEDDNPVRVDAVVVSTQHSEDVTLEQLRSDIKEHLIKKVIPSNMLDEDTKYFINPTGRFVIGGPKGDSGLCLAEGTLVNVKGRGLVPIEELKVGDTVTTETGEANIIEFYDNGVKPTKAIKDTNGKDIEGTYNHPFRVVNSQEELVWVEAQDLKVGDYVVYKKDEFLQEVSLDALMVDFEGDVDLFRGVPRYVLAGTDDVKRDYLRALAYRTFNLGSMSELGDDFRIVHEDEEVLQVAHTLLLSLGYVGAIREYEDGLYALEVLSDDDLFNIGDAEYFKNKGLVVSQIGEINDSTAHTYDITLDDETHSFVANGFIVHNTGRKIIVDTYGGYFRHGGGAFSGKDCTKVDRSASYMARYIAKNIVGAGLASKCEIQLSYAIGVADPTSIRVDTFGTGVISESDLVSAIRKVFKLTPAGIIEQLGLRKPIYSNTAAYGHFGRELDEFTWERLDKVDELKALLG